MQQEASLFDKIFSDKYRVVFHLFFWMYIYLSDVLGLLGIIEFEPVDEVFFIISILDVLVVYLNLYVLIPQLLFRRKYFGYLSFTLMTILVNSFISFYLTYPWEEVDVDPEFDPPYIDFIFGSFEGTLQMVVLAITVKLFKFYVKNRRTINRLETTNLRTELTFLKNQINPHFLFNALNGIYVLTRKKATEAPESVLLLSEMLRYQLYDCSRERVLLRKELSYIEKYLALEKMRRKDAIIQFKIVGSPDNRQVAPFLFIPFIENAFKHGFQAEEIAYVSIIFTLHPDTLRFECVNSIEKGDTQAIKKDGGIGLLNVKRRLALLYPNNQHQLLISQRNGNYEVTLVVQDLNS